MVLTSASASGLHLVSVYDLAHRQGSKTWDFPDLVDGYSVLTIGALFMWRQG